MTTDVKNPWGVSAGTLQTIEQPAQAIQTTQPVMQQSALPSDFLIPPAPEIPTDPNSIQYATATFQGMYFKGVGQQKEAVSFTKQVKVPHSCLRALGMHPAWVFLQVAPDLLGREPGYGGVRNVDLVMTTPLPRDMDRDAMLNWTAAYDDLMLFIKRYTTNVRYTPTNFKDDGKVLPAKVVSVVPELFTTPTALRGAIRRCLADPEAFAKEQEKQEKLWTDPEKKDLRNLNKELKALNAVQH